MYCSVILSVPECVNVLSTVVLGSWDEVWVSSTQKNKYYISHQNRLQRWHRYSVVYMLQALAIANKL